MRLPDWELRLRKLLQDRQSTPFAWGPNDCITFCADNVLALTGVDPMASMRGQWDGALTAHKLLRTYGSLYAAVVSVVGPPMTNRNMIQRGDIGLCISQKIEVMAVCVGEYLVAPSKKGLFKIYPNTLQSAWAVGRPNG